MLRRIRRGRMIITFVIHSHCHSFLFTGHEAAPLRDFVASFLPSLYQVSSRSTSSKFHCFLIDIRFIKKKLDLSSVYRVCTEFHWFSLGSFGEFSRKSAFEFQSSTFSVRLGTISPYFTGFLLISIWFLIVFFHSLPPVMAFETFTEFFTVPFALFLFPIEVLPLSFTESYQTQHIIHDQYWTSLIKLIIFVKKKAIHCVADFSRVFCNSIDWIRSMADSVGKSFVLPIVFFCRFFSSSPFSSRWDGNQGRPH